MAFIKPFVSTIWIIFANIPKQKISLWKKWLGGVYVLISDFKDIEIL